MLWRQCLYAFFCDRTGLIGYVGKAGRCTARQRVFAADKVRVERRLKGVLPGPFHVFVGKLRFGQGRRNSHHNLGDVETLLIYELDPPGNTAARKTRVCWPGLSVHCEGDWPHDQAVFHDID